MYLDLKTGTTTAFPVHEHPRVLNDGMSGTFSPDGKYVLISYSYDPDDHYQGGHLQVFTVDGEFVAEVATSEKFSIAQAYWLHNDWIVHGVAERICFVKFVTP